MDNYLIYSTDAGCPISNGMSVLQIESEWFDFPDDGNLTENKVNQTYIVAGIETTDGTVNNGQRNVIGKIGVSGCPREFELLVSGYLNVTTDDPNNYSVVPTVEITVTKNQDEFFYEEDAPATSTAEIDETLPFSYEGACPVDFLIEIKLRYDTSANYPVTLDYSITIDLNEV